MYSENSISKKLQTFAEKNDWLISGEYIYGDEQGYLFSGLDGKGEKTFITPVPGITEDQQTELFGILEKNKSTMKLTEYTITDDFLCIRIKDSTHLKTDDIEFILALLVGNLQELAIDSVGRCQECGKAGAEKESFIYDLYCYMHEDCIKTFDEEKDADSSEASEETDSGKKAIKAIEETEAVLPDTVSTIKKVLYTIAGAAVGSLPWLFLPYIMGFVEDLLAKVTTSTLATNFTQSLLTCLCAYLVSYMAIFGYRLSKAKMNKKGRWIVGIVSIAVVVLIQFAYIAVLIIKEPSVSLTWSNYIINLVKSSFYINMLLGALIGIVFTLISVLPFFDTSISSVRAKKLFSNKTDSKSAEEITEEQDPASEETGKSDKSDSTETKESSDTQE